MASCKSETLLPLDRFAQILGIHPLHFNQVAIQGKASPCGAVWLQYDWQGPTATSRESVGIAINSAEMRLEEYLGFPVYPKWYEDVQVHTVGNPVVLPKAYYISGGVKTKTKIGTESVTYEDVDEDDFAEKATTRIATSVTDTDEIAIYYPDEDGDDAWRVRPIKVAIDSGVATITLNRYDLVIKNELEALKPVQIDGTDDDKFLDSVDIYRVYNDPSTQALLRSCSLCSQTGCSACQFTDDNACLLGVDHKCSIVNANPGLWDGTKWNPATCFRNDVYSGRYWFKAGWTREPIWDTVITYLALSEIDVGLCTCPTVQERLKYWTTDMSRIDRPSWRIPKALENCPWGYSRGAMYAYQIAQKHKMPQGAA